MIRNRWIAAVAVCTLVVALAPNQADAQTIPFHIVGAGFGPEGLPLPGQGGRPHWAVGQGTALGWYFGEGEVETDTAEPQSNGNITGLFGSPVMPQVVPFVFTGANGDNLACVYGRTDFGADKPGTFTLVPVARRGPGWYIALFVAEFVPYDSLCTGKFEGVSGSWIMYAQTAPFLLGSTDPVFYTWEGSGALTFKKHH
jgi:hypothetical protein